MADYKITIYKKKTADGRNPGDTQQEVINREGEDCSLFVNVASRSGEVVSDEQTGPDCDTVHEGTAAGGNDAAF